MEATRFKGVHRVSPGLYLVRWEKRDPKTGKLRDRRKRVKAKSAEAANRERDAAMDEDGRTEAQRHTLTDFGASWLTGKMPDLSPSTRATYGQNLAHITSFVFRDGRCFGDFYLDAIDHHDVTAYREQSREGVRAATVNGRLRVLKTLFGDAVATLELPRDPTLRVKPLPKDAPRRVRAMEPVQLRALLDWMRDHESNPTWYPLVLALGVTAGRWSEVTALKWTDVDYRKRSLRVVRRNLRGHVVDGTKASRQVIRVLPMPDELADALKANRRRIMQDPVLAAGDWVFPSETGGPYKGGSGSIAKPLARAAIGAKLGRVVSAHDFRHTWNNILRQVTDDEVQKAITGHSTDDMRMHYAHVGHEEKLTAMAAGLRLLKGGE